MTDGITEKEMLGKFVGADVAGAEGAVDVGIGLISHLSPPVFN